MKTRRHRVKHNPHRLSGKTVEIEEILPNEIAYVRDREGERHALQLALLDELDPTPLAPCLCCGMAPTEVRKLDDTFMVADLCTLCVSAEYREGKSRVGTFRFLWCPEHGQNNFDREVFFLALDLFNTKFGEQKRGPRVRYGLNWTDRLAELRNEWRDRENESQTNHRHSS